jgi:hypothetical protein
MRLLSLVAFAAALVAPANLAFAQDAKVTVNWVGPSTSQTPPPRASMGMAYDAATHSTLLFGGTTNPETLGDTWSWTYKQGWAPLSPASAPSPRQGPGMAYDGATGHIVLFGGEDAHGRLLNDTWTWDGTNWNRRFPPTSPPAREFTSQGMVYDKATGTVLMFGGAGSHGNPIGDTWIWDGIAKTWTQQFPSASPSPRRAPMAFDEKSGTVVLFGGDDPAANIQFGDTWIWDGTNWTEQFPTSAPSARASPTVAYDAALGVVVLFGGFGPWPDVQHDTWIWNGTDWKKVRPTTVPPNRYAAGMDYDPLVKGVVMFGGFSSGPGRNDTWVFTWLPIAER